jgi:hypothetical protein
MPFHRKIKQKVTTSEAVGEPGDTLEVMTALVSQVLKRTEPLYIITGNILENTIIDIRMTQVVPSSLRVWRVWLVDSPAGARLCEPRTAQIDFDPVTGKLRCHL